jgi:hypothetical protein
MFYIRGFENAVVFEATGLAGASASATFNGSVLDMGATDDQMYLMQDILASAGTFGAGAGLFGKLQQCPTSNGTFTDCNPIAASLPQASTAIASGSNQIPIAGYMRDYRYVKYVGTIVGASGWLTPTAYVVGEKKKI